MNTYIIKGYTTSDYEAQRERGYGRWDFDDIKFDVMRVASDDDFAEAEEFTLNYMTVIGDILIANATVKHWFEETVECDGDQDDAEEKFFSDSDTAHGANKDHNGKRLIDIDEIYQA